MPVVNYLSGQSSDMFPQREASFEDTKQAYIRYNYNF